MFKPLEMVKVSLQVLHSDAAKVTHAIAKQGLFHLLDSQKFLQHVGKAGGEKFEGLMDRYGKLEQDLKDIFKNLSLGRTIRKEIEVEPAKEIDAIEEAVKRTQHELKSPSDQLERIEKQRKTKEEQLQLLGSIASAGPDLELVRKFTYFYKAVGFIVSKDIPRLEASLASIHFALVPLTTVEHRRLVTVLCSQKDKETLNRALTSAYFEHIKLPNISKGSIKEVIERLGSEIVQLTEKKARLSQELKETQAHGVKELQVLMEKVALALLILNAELHYGKGTRAYIILGWLPKNQLEIFQKDILEVTEGRTHFEISEPEMVEEVQQGKIKIPILFNNPFFIRPFEALVFNYGTQDYKAIDPTPVVAMSFLLMFGMMFGDVGHGLVLFLLGYWVFKKFYQYMDYGIIVMECGISSAIFGLLYGSIFGIEHLIPALWLHPAESIDSFMMFAIGVGVVMISSGVILNIVNSFQRKDYESGILGHYGIVGGLFYWISVGLGVKYAIYGDLGMSANVLIILLAVPLGVIFFKEPLGHILFKKEEEEGKIFPSGVLMFAIESVMDLIDVVVRYLASTVSFVRTAAFALAHGGLFIAIFSLAEIMGELQGGGLWYGLVILLGNVLVIALEGLVVSIQTVRLEYYEFFSKFFKDGGEKFQPLKIE